MIDRLNVTWQGFKVRLDGWGMSFDVVIKPNFCIVFFARAMISACGARVVIPESAPLIW